MTFSFIAGLLDVQQSSERLYLLFESLLGDPIDIVSRRNIVVAAKCLCECVSHGVEYLTRIINGLFGRRIGSDVITPLVELSRRRKATSDIVTEGFINSLDNGTHGVRTRSVNALSMIGTETAFNLLLGYLNDENETFRNHVARA